MTTMLEHVLARPAKHPPQSLASLDFALPPDLEDACDAVLSMAPGSDDVTLLALRRA